MKKWIATLALATASLASYAGIGVVNGNLVSDNGTVADPYELGSITMGSSVSLGVAVYGQKGNDFEEHANFTVAQDLSLSGSAATYSITFFGIKLADINDFAVELWSGVHPTGNTFIAEFDGSNTVVSFGSLTAGQYHLDIFGTLGASLGLYSVTLQAAPVPEPSTYALLLAGLGVIGFVARRRREMV